MPRHTYSPDRPRSMVGFTPSNDLLHALRCQPPAHSSPGVHHLDREHGDDLRTRNEARLAPDLALATTTCSDQGRGRDRLNRSQ